MMVAIFSILLTVAFIGVIKALFIVGVSADIQQYAAILHEVSVIELTLWFLIAITGRNMLLNKEWFKSAYTSSISTRMVEGDDGELIEQVQSRFGSTLEYEPAKKALKQSKIAFTAAILGLVFLYLF